MLRRMAAAAAAGLAAGTLMLANPAQADTFPASGWEVLDTAADGTRSPSAHSTIVDDTTAQATWASGETASAAGTSVEAANLDLPVGSGVEVAVDYELLGGASPAAASVRLFIYYTADADTWATAPDQMVSAPDDGTTAGTLAITTDQAGTIGTIGLVYDTSNGGVPGTVKFTDLTIGEELVLFNEPVIDPPPGVEEPPNGEEPIVLDPTDPETFSCDIDFQDLKALVDEFGIDVVVEALNAFEGIDFEPDLTAEHLQAFFDRCEPEPAPEPTDEPGAGGGDTDDKSGLPNTGTPMPLMVGGGLLLIAAGAGALLLARRRRFSAAE